LASQFETVAQAYGTTDPSTACLPPRKQWGSDVLGKRLAQGDNRVREFGDGIPTLPLATDRFVDNIQPNGQPLLDLFKYLTGEDWAYGGDRAAFALAAWFHESCSVIE
jgi:hypothetical protein